MSNEAIVSATSHPKRVSRLFGKYLVKNRFQFKFSFVIFIFLSAAAFTIWFEGQWAIGRMVTEGMLQSTEAAEHLDYLNEHVAYTGIVMIVITFVLSLFFSHYVAGPIYRFERTLEAMKSGNLNIHVRL